MIALAAALLLAVAQDDDGARAAALQTLTRALARAEEVEVEGLAPALREPGALRAVLLETLVMGRVPGGSAPTLTQSQQELVLAALTGGSTPEVRAFLDETVREPRDAGRVAAALRLFGRLGRPADVRALRPLLAAFSPADSARIEDALEHAVVDWATRDPAVLDVLPGPCAELAEDAAGVVIRALGSIRSREALRCLCELLGQRDALAACVLQAIAATADRAQREEAAEIAGEVLAHLESDDVLRAAAAASALGRLRARSAVPELISALERDEASVARAALAALRGIGGVDLAASPSLWKHWYAHEERWWRERAPGVRAQLERAPVSAVPRAELVGLLAELSEHALYRDELAPVAERVLEHGDAEVRAFAARGLERLGGRPATMAATGRVEPAPR